MKQSVLSFFLLLITLISFKSAAQTPSGYSQPTSVAVCNTNGPFAVQVIAPPAGGWPTTPFTLSLEVFVAPPNSPFNPNLIPYPWGQFPECIQGVTGNNPVTIINSSIGDPAKFSVGLPTWNANTNSYDFIITKKPSTPVSTPIELLQFDLSLDCSLIPELVSAGSAVLIQKWFYNGTPAFSPTQVIPVQFPNIIEVPVAQQFVTINAPVNNIVQDWHFAYQNIGNSNANISITNFATEMCLNQSGGNNYQLNGSNPILFQTSNLSTTPTNWNLGSPNVFSYPGVVNISISPQEFLHIRQQVNILDCMTSCNGIGTTLPKHVNFSWKCANTVAPPSCADCQKMYEKELFFTSGSPSYEIRRLAPTDAVALNNTECQGGSTPWTYEVKNTGDAILKDVMVKISYPNINALSFISSTSIVINYQSTCLNPPCSTLATFPYTNPLPVTCSALPSNLIREFNLHLFDLEPNQTASFTFTIENAASEDPILFNQKKYFNHWNIISEAITTCSQLINPDYTNSRNGFNTGISGYSTPSYFPTDDLNLISTINGNPSHTTVYPNPSGQTFGSPIFYSVAFNGLLGSLNDLQSMGGNALTNTPVSGYLKVEFDCAEGLSIGNPNNVALTFGGLLQIFPVAFDPSTFNCGGYVLTASGTSSTSNNIPVSVFPSINCDCGPKLYTVYFKLSDLDNLLPPGLSRDEFFNSGKLTYGFNACCPVAISPSLYTIKISLLPNENCFNLINGVCSTLTTPATCCWLPLSSEQRSVFVHCPGCLAPGVIIDNYNMRRTSLGFPDFNDNSKAESSTPITYLPNQWAQNPTYSPYNQLELEFSTYGDQLEDYLIAHFQNGENDPSFGGYEYLDMTNNGVVLDVLQLFRKFPLSEAGKYDVQVTGFDLYIDDAGFAGTCLDEWDFQLQPTPLPTILKFSVDANSPVFPSFYAKSGSEMLFTFERSLLNQVSLPNGVTRNLYAGATLNDIDFRINQIYRIRVRYKVCGNPDALNPGHEDLSSINDILFLTGAARTIPFSDSKMPNTIVEACSNLLNPTCFPQFNCSSSCTGTPSISQTNFADHYMFYCEGNGTNHHFISTLCSNVTIYGLDQSNSVANCVGVIDMRTTSRFDKSMNPPFTNKFFKYEYKTPKLFQKNLILQEPANWNWQTNLTSVDATLTSYSCESVVWCANGGSNPLALNITPGPILNIDLHTQLINQGLAFNCIQENTFPPFSSPLIADEISNQRIIFKVYPENCSSQFTPVPEPITAAVVTFSNNEESCSEPLLPTQSCSLNITENNASATDPQRTLSNPNPNLTFNIIPLNYSVNTGEIRWEFDFKNESTTAFPFPTPAQNVYLNVGNNLTGSWEVDYILMPINQSIPAPVPGTQYGTVINTLSQNNYFWLLPNLINNVQQNILAVGYRLHGVLTFRFTDCSQLATTHNFIGGWNCTQISDAPLPTNICGYAVEPVTFSSLQGDLTALAAANSNTYTPCDPVPITLTAQFINMGLTDLIPTSLTIASLPGSIVQLTSNPPSINSPCQNNPNTSPSYTIGTGSGNTWPITNTSNNDLLSQGECFTVEFEITTNGCHFGQLEMPVVTILGEDFCGNDFDCSNSIPPLNPSNTSLCTDCFSIIKTATPGPAIVGEPYVWNITVCGNNDPNNASTQTSTFISENYPFNFIPISPSGTSFQVNNIPTQGCTTVAVLGAFNDVGECINVVNTATIQNTTLSSSACVDVVCPSPLFDIYVETDADGSAVFQNVSQLSNKKINVADYVVLTINQSIQFINCEFYMGSGSEIKVNTLQQLTLDKSNITSCPYMWKGIHLEPAARLYADLNTIKDAENAVFAQHDAIIYITNSKIYDCVTGVQTELSANQQLETYFGSIYGTEFGKAGLILKKEYLSNNGQPAQPPHGKIGRAGISLYDVDNFTIGDNSKNQNKFFNINFGVDLKNANVDITNSYFKDIRSDLQYKTSLIQQLGAAVYADNKDYVLGLTRLRFRPLAASTNTIEDSDFGLFNRVYNVDLSGISMVNVETGIRGTENANCINIISNCEIHSNKTSVYWYNNTGADRMLLSENRIFNSKFFGAAIVLDEFWDNNFANYQIQFNPMLEAVRGGVVIQTNNVDNALIGYNNILVSDPQSQIAIWPLLSGINLNAGKTNNIYCNSTNTNISHLLPSSSGIFVSQSTANTISCNNLNNATNGVYFGGDCNSTRLRGNALVENAIGLRLNGQATIGLQAHHGNRWFNNNSISTAYKAPGLIGPQLSLFRVHTQSLPFWPQNITPAAGWFFFDPGFTQFNCINNNVCIAFIDDPDPNDQARIATDRLIALDSIQFSEYNDEMLAIMRSRLYETILSDSSLYLSDPVFVDFYTDVLGSPTGEISNVGWQLAQAMTIDSVSYSTLTVTNNLINSVLDSITYIDSINRSYPDPTNDSLREQYTQQIKNLRNVAISILSAHSLTSGLIRDSLLLINSAIQPTELPDINRNSIYEILGEYYDRGDSVIYAYYNTLFPIAQQCPYAGGAAVYIARSLLRIINDSIAYYDDVVCLQAGYYRTMNTNNEKVQHIKLLPNPTKDIVEVFAISTNEMPGIIEIFNGIGEMVYNGISESGTHLKTIDVSSFSPGLYTLKVQLEGEFFMEKLVIIK